MCILHTIELIARLEWGAPLLTSVSESVLSHIFRHSSEPFPIRPKAERKKEKKTLDCGVISTTLTN
jgi:hypothetical protein